MAAVSHSANEQRNRRMAGSGSPEVTQLLLAWSEGDQTAFDRLVPLVYAELHRLAKPVRR
jgi:hypothetical protein